MKNTADEGAWDATCRACSHEMMEGDWETDGGPDGDEDIRFCPMCGEQLVIGIDEER